MILTKGAFREQLFESVYHSFARHIFKPGNDRIVCSGKFGIGKSFFLDHFFKGETQEKRFGKIEFKAFHLFPVNYSIAANEDIYRYIKYDVINSMLLNKVQLEEKDFKRIDTLPAFLRYNWLKLLSTLVYMIPKMGRSVSESFKKVEALNNDFTKYTSASSSPEGDELVNYIGKIEKTEGSIFETDLVTELIRSILTRLKDESGHRNVLIIDDLDRIDPAHVFRILNVFAAHLDNPEGLTNKLGFDTIIVVCDIANLRSIFSANYGLDTDFNGYIDKFYSREIFYFDNRKALMDIAHEAFRSVNFLNAIPPQDPYYRSALFRSNSLPLELLRLFISFGFVSLRNLLSRIESKVDLDVSKYLVFEENLLIRQIDVLVLAHFAILKELLGGYDIIKETIDRIPLRGLHLSQKNKYCTQLLYFVKYNETFNKKGTVGILFRERCYFLKLPQKITEELESLVLAETENDDSVTVNFTSEEFKILIDDFLDLMIRIEKKE